MWSVFFHKNTFKKQQINLTKLIRLSNYLFPCLSCKVLQGSPDVAPDHSQCSGQGSSILDRVSSRLLVVCLKKNPKTNEQHEVMGTLLVPNSINLNIDDDGGPIFERLIKKNPTQAMEFEHTTRICHPCLQGFASYCTITLPLITTTVFGNIIPRQQIQ